MNIEIIGKDKVRVIISETELAERHLTHESLKQGSAYLNKFLFEIMEKIRHTTKFDPYAGQVVVEAVKSGDGLMMIISKAKRTLTKEDKARIRRATPKIKKPEEETCIYIFEDFEDLCAALVRLDCECFEKSSLYRVDNTFYFVLKQKDGFLKSAAILSEFCLDVASTDITKFLLEHSNFSLSGYKLLDTVKNLY